MFDKNEAKKFKRLCELKVIEDILEPFKYNLKTKLKDFYSKNIGTIEKTSAIDLYDFAILQDSHKKIEQGTIKIDKNKFVLISTREDQTIYIPFKTKKSYFVMEDVINDEVLVDIETNYTKVKNISKSELFERIYNKYKESFKKEKITKTAWKKYSIDEAEKVLSNIEINDLQKALNIYTIKETKKFIYNKEKIKDIKKNKDYQYKDFIDEIIKNSSSDIEILSKLKTIFEQIKKEKDRLEIELFKDKDDFKSNEFISKKIEERIVLEKEIDISKIDDDLLYLFDSEYDIKKINDHARKNEVFAQALGQKVSFIFHDVCNNLTELIDKVNTIDFLSKQQEEYNYEEDQVISLNIMH